ncbi:MAG: hypothetical protein IPQ07_44410 [Myxococcales bacterium]|nr:hypothetical protein [Myxococcales bacterium]
MKPSNRAFALVVLIAIPGLGLGSLAGCYSPELAPCTVSCSAATPCPDEATCGADNFCHADGETATCTVPHHVAVTLSGTGGGQVTSNIGGIGCQPLCEASIDEGTVVTFSATADASSRFSGWVGACSGTGPCTLTIGGDVTLGAQFTTARPLNLSFTGSGTGRVTSAPTGLDCTAGCTALFDNNANVTLTMAPDVSSRFVGWGGDCASAGTNATCGLTVDHVATVSVDLKKTPLLTVTPMGSGTGTVTSNPSGINCGATCTKRFDENTSIVLSATTTGANAFTQWMVGGACGGSTAPTCNITLDSDKVAIPIFNARRDLTVSIVGSGTVGGDLPCTTGPCTGTFDLNTLVSLTATPAPGWRFGGFSGSGCTGTGPCMVTLSASSSVTATFIELHDLTLSFVGMGTVTASLPPAASCSAGCTLVEDHNVPVLLTATAAPSWRFDHWTGGGCGSGPTCTVPMTGATSVTATFIETRTLAVSVVGNGTVTSSIGGITCPGTCTAAIDIGLTVTLTATSNPGVRSVSFDTCGAVTTCGAVMTANRTVATTFVGGGRIWSKQYGGTPTYGREAVNAVAVDPTGHVVMTGGLSGGETMDFDGTVRTSGPTSVRDVMVASYNADGTLRWAQVFGGTSGTNVGQALAIAPNGDVIVGGQFATTLTAGSLMATSAGGQDGFLCWLDATTGTPVQLITFGGAGNEEVRGLASSAGNGLHILGSTTGGNFTFPGAPTPLMFGGAASDFLVNLDAASAYRWSRVLFATPTAFTSAKKILMTANGDAIVFGHFGGATIDLGGGNLSAGTRETLFLARYAATTGAHVWSEDYGGSSPGGHGNATTAADAALTSAGDIVVTGWFDQFGDPVGEDVSGNGSSLLLTSGANDMFVATYAAANGAHTSSFRFGSADPNPLWLEAPVAIATDASGDLTLIGHYSTPTITLGDDTITNLGEIDVFFLRLTSTGQARWLRSFGSTLPERASSIAVSSTGQPTVGGYYLNDHSLNACTFDGATFASEDEGYLITLSK